MAEGTIFERLDPIFHPRSVALIGASGKPGKIGRLFVDAFMESGFRELYPVNPGERDILGFQAYPSVLLIPYPVDMAVIITPAATTPAVVKECVAKGVRTIVINTAGFGESGIKGKEAQDEMVRVAREGGARIIGPNCIGIYCPASKLPFLLKQGREAGSVGLVSQSGFFADYLTMIATERGIHFSKAVSCGNESDLTAVDFLEYLGEDPETETIVAYIEGLREGRRFYDAARKISRKKPIILLRGGLTEGGARAAASHTGALAGSRPVWEGVLRHTGIVPASSFEEVLDCLYAFHLQPLPSGARVGIVSGPGGIAVATTDACLELGLGVPQFSPATAEKLRASMPVVGGSVANPIDLSLASLLGPRVFRDAVRILSGEKNIDMILVIAVVGGERLRDLILGAVDGLTTKKPIAVVVMAGTPEAVERDCRTLIASGISAYPDALRAVKALHRLSGYARFRERLQASPDDAAGVRRRRRALPAQGRHIILKAASEGKKVLSEHGAGEVLRLCGIPVAREREAFDEPGFRRALGEIGFPAVIKAGGPELSHKTEKGLVYLDIRDEHEALVAFTEIMDKRKGRETSVLVQEMIRGSRELIIGLVRDRLFGPCVMIGAGGIFSETLKDNTFRAAPIDRQDALDMIDELKCRASLGPFRGMPAADLGRIADILVKVAAMGAEQREIKEIDINPVMISGDRPIAVDALIVLEDE